MKTDQSEPTLRGGAAGAHWPMLNGVDRMLEKADTALNLICVSLIMFLMFFAAAEIIGRYFFNAPIPGHIEIVELLMVGVVFLGLAYTQLQDGHIRMQILEKRFFKGRAFNLAEALISLLSLLPFVMITYFSFLAALDAYEFGDVTSYINWPTWPSKMCIPLGGFFLCLRLVVQFIQRMRGTIYGVNPTKNVE
jgi:TRAP-type C4-dicarboxylate transport system permease small subunit